MNPSEWLARPLRQKATPGLWLAAIVLFTAGCATPPPAEKSASAGPVAPVETQSDKVPSPDTGTLAYGPEFWQGWGDGQAELAGYSLRTPRYGSVREGTAVAIFVTEHFSNEARVKADPGKHAKTDEFPVMKLNLMEDFPTGIYDYNVMTSVFVALQAVNGRPAGRATKISFSAQEWCGHVYHQLLFDQQRIRSTLHSYFDGEGDEERDLPAPREGISEDELLFWARGMAEPKLQPGQSRSLPLLPSLKRARFAHQPLGWREVRLSRAVARATVEVPAGSFEADVFTAELPGGPTRTFYVETAMPHRVVKWATSDGEAAELLNSARTKYWELNSPQGVERLRELGLNPRPPHTM
ncbi:MAG: hypothetical protein KIT83_18400 [Bryobacterales bacterium]|nr:hypothetical protein [Bryobacterales bacterium]